VRRIKLDSLIEDGDGDAGAVAGAIQVRLIVKFEGWN